jgi:hypothetical protein
MFNLTYDVLGGGTGVGLGVGVGMTLGRGIGLTLGGVIVPSAVTVFQTVLV